MRHSAHKSRKTAQNRKHRIAWLEDDGRLERSRRQLLRAAGRARRQVLLLYVEDVSCAHGAQRQHPQQAQVPDLSASDRHIGHSNKVAGEEAREWGGGAGPGAHKNESFVVDLAKDDLVGVGGRLEGLPVSSSGKELDAAGRPWPPSKCTSARPVQVRNPDLGVHT